MACLAVLLGQFASGAASQALAEIPDVGVKIGVVTDMSGIFSAFAGPGSVAAANLAAEEFGNQVNGKPITILSMDHQNKADIAAAGTRRWFDEGVDMTVDYPVSSAALAAQEVAREKKRIIIFSSAGASALSGKLCSPYGFQWLFDAYGLSNGLIRPLADRGLDSFFFISADYAAGAALEAEFRAAIRRAGLTAVGGVKYSIDSTDMSSPVMMAMASPAKAIVIAGAGADMVNAIKAAKTFGLEASGKALVTPATFITDIKAVGLSDAQGLMFVDAFYWNRNDRTRRFAKAFASKTNAMPTSAQAGVYSGVRHYLRAVQAANSVDGDVVAAKMRELPVDDDALQGGTIRPDGRMAHDMLVVRVKSPAQSHGEWDLLQVMAEIPAQSTVRPLAESGCPLLPKQ